MAINITINREALDKISEEIGDKTAQELKSIGDDQSLLLKQIALRFLESVEKNLQKIKIVENRAKRLKEYRQTLKNQGKDLKKIPQDKEAIEKYEKFKKDLEEEITIDTSLQDFFKECLIFNDSLVEVITGRKTKVTIVIPASGESPIIKDFTLEELLDENSGVSFVQDVTSKKIPRITGRLKFDIEKIKQNLKKGLSQDKFISIKELEALNETYNSALYDNYNKFKPYVFWKPVNGERWLGMKISGGAGDISEGYAYFYYKSQETNFGFSERHLYDNLDVFFRKGVGSVSNLSGLYGGDISTIQYEYAVKSLNASLPGYLQMIRIAQNIINNKIPNATSLKNKALKAKFKDPINRQGEKGLRNFVINQVADELLKEHGLTN